MRRAESELQQACIRAFALKYRKLWDSKRLHAVPNGGYRSAKTAAIQKMEGQMSGVWDLNLTVPRGNYGGLWIEMKATTNLSDSQKAFQESHKDDYAFAVCRTVGEFLTAIEDYLAPREV